MDDIVALNQFWYSTSPVLRKQRRKRLLLAAVLYSIATAISGYISRSVGTTLFCCAVFFIIWLWLFYSSRKLNVKRIVEMYSKDKNFASLGQHQLEITGSGVRGSNPISEGEVKFAGIERIESTKTHVFIILGSVSGYIIPRNQVTEGNLEEFITELESKLTAGK